MILTSIQFVAVFFKVILSASLVFYKNMKKQLELIEGGLEPSEPLWHRLRQDFNLAFFRT